MNPEDAARRPSKRLKRLAIAAAVCVGFLHVGWLWWQSDMPGPQARYRLDLDRAAPPAGRGFFAGAAAVDITPRVDATSADAPPVWIAGFGRGRAATAVHDPLWARALYIELHGVRVALVAVDLIGLFHEEVLRCRAALVDEVDYLLVASTHTHGGPDTMGLWGPSLFRTGVDLDYLERVHDGIVESVRAAARARRPALARAASTRFGAGEVVMDYKRAPFVIDDTLGVLHVVADTPERPTIGTLVAWASHPEVMESGCTLITSDFPHWLREGIEHGVGLGGRDPVPGLGGVCVFVNGAVGGMITSMAMDLVDRETDEVLRVVPGEPISWRRPQAVGDRVAARALQLLRAPDAGASNPPAYAPLDRLRVRARTLRVPIENRVFWAAGKLGVIRRATTGAALNTEVALLDVGPVRLACVPGELYPELAIGGIESPPGADYPGEPVEVPPLKELLADPLMTHLWVVGLANDAIGYLIPRTQWDAPKLPWAPRGRPPYLYDAAEPPYGEINSASPGAAAAVHKAFAQVAGGS